MGRLRVRCKGTIEDCADEDPSGDGSGDGAGDGPVWQGDFANSLVGGGVLGRGCVQEEIRCPATPYPTQAVPLSTLPRVPNPIGGAWGR
jgi:hypothetical protein